MGKRAPFDIDWDHLEIDDMELAELQRLAEELQNPPKEGWQHTTGVSPLKIQLQVIKRMLELTKAEYEKEHERQLRRYADLLRSQVKNDPRHTVRIKKNVHKR